MSSEMEVQWITSAHYLFCGPADSAMGFSFFLKLTQPQLPIFMPDSQEYQITGFQTVGDLLYFRLFNL